MPTVSMMFKRTSKRTTTILTCLGAATAFIVALGVPGTFAAPADAADRITLTAETGRPEMSYFIPGEKVEITFVVQGLAPGRKDLTLTVDVRDERDRAIERKEWSVRATARGQWRTVYAAPRPRLGFYRVAAKLSNGVTLPALGSRPAGFITYCIVPDPARRRLYPETETRFGMQGGFSPAVQILPYLGIRWVLGGYTWRRTEPEHAGQFTAARTKAHAAGKPPRERTWNWPRVKIGDREEHWQVYPMPCLFFAPKWAVRPETASYCTGTLTPNGETAWRTYCTAVAQAFTEDYPELGQHVFQITWEPVYPWGFKGSDEDLIRIYKIAYPALHAADPQVLVLGPTGGGISQSGVRWNLNLLEKGLGRYVDGWSIHPYIALPPERHGLIENVRALKEAIHQYAGRDLPLYGTEQGKPTDEKVEEELAQARGLLRANLIMLGEGFLFNFAFYITDYSTESGYGYNYNLRKGKPWGASKVGPKPIAPAYAAQSFLLEGHTSAGPIEWLGPTAVGYAFQRGSEVTLALWDYGNRSRTITLPIGHRGDVKVFDWMGNGQETAVPAGTLELSLGPEPVYVRGVSPATWGRNAHRPLRLATHRVTAEPGKRVTVAGAVGAVSGAPQLGDFRVEADERLGLEPVTASVAPRTDKSVPFALELTIPPDAGFGRYTVRVVLRRNGQAVAADGFMLRIAPAVTIEAVTPALLPGEAPGIHIALRETQNREIRGRMHVRLRGVPGTAQSAEFHLSAGAGASLSVGFPEVRLDPTRVYPAILTFETADAGRFTREFPINMTPAAKFATAPVVDGRLDDWDGTEGIPLEGCGHVVRSPDAYNGPDDLAAVLRYAWDAERVYLAVDVTDDVFLQRRVGFDTWRQDCLQLGFNLDPFRRVESTGNLLAEAGARVRYTEIDLAQTPKGPELYRTVTFDKKRLPVGLLSAKDATLTVVRSANHTVYEAAIPWTALGAAGPMSLGRAVGVAMTVNDADDPEQRAPSALGLFGGITPVKDPTRFGVLLLSGVPVRKRAEKTPESAALVFSGVLGQSQPAGDDALPFVGTMGAALDSKGGLWTASGGRLYRFHRGRTGDRRLDRKVKCPPGVAPRLPLCSDGKDLFFGGANRIYVFSPNTPEAEPRLFCTAVGNITAFAVAPTGLHKRFAARAKCFVLSDDTVSAFAADGTAVGTVLELSRPPSVKWSYRSIGILPETGDLLVGSYWPDSKVYRFTPDGQQEAGADWPRKACAAPIVTVGGQAWAMVLGGSAVPLPAASGNRAEITHGLDEHWTFYCNGLALDPDGGYWMSTTQGLIHFDARRLPDGKRLGGIGNVRSLAVAPDGTVVASVERGQRLLRLYLDDAPGAPLACNGNEPFRTAAGWTHRTADLAWNDRTFLALDQTGKQLWNFDPWHTAWREKPWVQRLTPNTLTAPRALSVGDLRFYLLDGAHLLTGITREPARMRDVKLSPEAKLAAFTRMASANDDTLLFLAGPHRVIAFRRNGDRSLVQAWQTSAEFAGIADIAAGPGYLAVSDNAARTIVLLSSRDGKQLARVTEAVIPGKMLPTAIAARGPWVVVADTKGHRLLRFEVK